MFAGDNVGLKMIGKTSKKQAGRKNAAFGAKTGQST